MLWGRMGGQRGSYRAGGQLRGWGMADIGTGGHRVPVPPLPNLPVEPMGPPSVGRGVLGGNFKGWGGYRELQDPCASPGRGMGACAPPCPPITQCLCPPPASQSAQWYAWGPPNMQCRLCASCWIYWKKYGGLKTPTQLEGAARGASVSPGNTHPQITPLGPPKYTPGTPPTPSKPPWEPQTPNNPPWDPQIHFKTPPPQITTSP